MNGKEKMIMKTKYFLILTLVFIFCLPIGVFAEGGYPSITAEVPVDVVMSEGDKLSSVVVMEPQGEVPAPLQSELMFTSSGNDVFKIEISEPGSFRYTVYQKQTDRNDSSYDDTVYDVTVFVTTDIGNNFKYVVTAIASDTGKKPDKIEFDNRTNTDDKRGGRRIPSERTDESDTSSRRGRITTPSSVIDTVEPDTAIHTDNTREDESGGETPTEMPTENTSISETKTDNDGEVLGNEGGTDTDKTDENETAIDNSSYIKQDDVEGSDSEISETAVKTGDNTHQSLWIAIMCLSAAVFLLTFAAEKIHTKKQ